MKREDMYFMPTKKKVVKRKTILMTMFDAEKKETKEKGKGGVVKVANTRKLTQVVKMLKVFGLYGKVDITHDNNELFVEGVVSNKVTEVLDDLLESALHNTHIAILRYLIDIYPRTFRIKRDDEEVLEHLRDGELHTMLTYTITKWLINKFNIDSDNPVSDEIVINQLVCLSNLKWGKVIDTDMNNKLRVKRKTILMIMRDRVSAGDMTRNAYKGVVTMLKLFNVYTKLTLPYDKTKKFMNEIAHSRVKETIDGEHVHIVKNNDLSLLRDVMGKYSTLSPTDMSAKQVIGYLRGGGLETMLTCTITNFLVSKYCIGKVDSGVDDRTIEQLVALSKIKIIKEKK